MEYNLTNYLLEDDSYYGVKYLEEAFTIEYIMTIGAKNKSVGEKLMEKFKLSKEEIKKKLLESDKSNDKKYIMFIASSWLNKRVEDIDGISDVVNRIVTLAKNNTKGSKDLLHLMEKNKTTYDKVLEFYNKHKEVDTKENAYDGFELVVEDKYVKVYKIDEWKEAPETKKHICFVGTHWCVQNKDMFDGYKPPYYLFVIDDKPYALYEPKSKQFKNVDDYAITLKEYEKIKDVALPLIKKNNPEIFEDVEKVLLNTYLSAIAALIEVDPSELGAKQNDLGVVIDGGKTYDEALVNVFFYDGDGEFPEAYNINKTQNIINKHKEMFIKILDNIKDTEIGEYCFPLYSFTPTQFKKEDYDFYKKEIEEEIKYIIKRPIKNKDWFGHDYYIFNYYSKEIQEEIKTKYPKEYQAIKFHLDNNPMMKYLPKPKLEESKTHYQANYLLS